MSSKKNTPKPAAQNQEPEAADEVIAGQTQPGTDDVAAEEAATEETQADPAAEPIAPVEAEQPESDASEVPAVIETIAEEPARPEATSRDRFSTRLTKAVNSIQTSGKAESVQALNKLDMLIGDLRNALPAAIVAAVDVSIDQDLERDLQSLFAAL